MAYWVEKITSVISNGVTQPLLGYINEKQVIIKHYQNRWGTQVLANELICYEIAKVLDITIPNAGICIINENTNIDELQDEEEICIEDIEGIGFYSEKIIKTIEFIDIDSDLLEKIVNRDSIIRIMLFDHIIFNADRRDDNMMLGYGKGIYMYIIDHSHVFHWENRNNIMGLDKNIDEEDYNDLKIMDKNIEFYKNFLTKENIMDLTKEKEFIISRLSEEKLRSIINKTPDKWLNVSEKETILRYLVYRINNLGNICNNIINYLEGGEPSESNIFSFEL